mmetsp:Transcript_105887/g.304278  ORF Transcript_105887/g.304278 Transcript_105887/m.304278 type:complete len:203 (-) Transcript_105887:1027-1635(-)
MCNDLYDFVLRLRISSPGLPGGCIVCLAGTLCLGPHARHAVVGTSSGLPLRGGHLLGLRRLPPHQGDGVSGEGLKADSRDSSRCLQHERHHIRCRADHGWVLRQLDAIRYALPELWCVHHGHCCTIRHLLRSNSRGPCSHELVWQAAVVAFRALLGHRAFASEIAVRQRGQACSPPLEQWISRQDATGEHCRPCQCSAVTHR